MGTVQVGVKMVRDEQQKRFAEMSPEFKRCQQNEQQGWSYSHNCTVAWLQASTLNNITVEMTRVGNPLSNAAYKMLYKFDGLIKYMLYPNLEVNPLMKSTEPSDVELYMKRDPFRQIWDIEAKKPNEIIRFHNVTENNMPLSCCLPFDLFMAPKLVVHKQNMPYFLPFRMYLTPEPILPKTVVMEQLYPTCVAQENYLKTFDNITLPLREISTTCWHLLARDCSEEARFGVLVKAQPNAGKETKVILGKTVVHIIPSLQEPQLFINGKPVHLTPESLIHPVYEYENGYQVAIVKLLPSNTVEIHSPLYQVKVYHDGQNVMVEPFSAYRGRMCGLCGDLNGERMADLKTPEMCTLNSTMVKEFFDSWILSEGTCRQNIIPENQCFRPQYIPTGKTASKVAPGTVRNMLSSGPGYDMKSIEIEVQHGKKCYSIEPIKVCKAGYVPSEYQPRMVEFYCAPEGEYVPPEQRSVDITEYMRNLPRDCVRH